MVAPLRDKAQSARSAAYYTPPFIVYKMLHRGASHHAAACRPAAPATRLLVVCMVSTPLSHALQLGPPPCLAHRRLVSALHQVSPRTFPRGSGDETGDVPHLPRCAMCIAPPPFLHHFCSSLSCPGVTSPSTPTVSIPPSPLALLPFLRPPPSFQAHPRRIAKVQSQVQREISDMLHYDSVREDEGGSARGRLPASSITSAASWEIGRDRGLS